jgi:hypothetical protein
MARDYGMNRQGLYPQEEARAGTLPFYRRGMKAKGGTVRMKKGGSAVVDTYAEPTNRNRRAEKSRVIGELNRGA